MRAGEDGEIRCRGHAAGGGPFGQELAVIAVQAHGQPFGAGGVAHCQGFPANAGRTGFDGAVDQGLEQGGLGEAVAHGERAKARLGVGADAGGDEVVVALGGHGAQC